MAKPLDPISGPIPREEFRALVDAPFGAAAKVIRKHDPLFGLKAGEKITWRVRFSATLYGEETVQAATKEEAEELADQLPTHSISFEDLDDSSVEIVEVEPRP